MQAIKRHVIPEQDGELALRDVPVKKDHPVEVIILSEDVSPECAATLALLRHDPGWAFLWDPQEDVYTQEDAESES